MLQVQRKVLFLSIGAGLECCIVFLSLMSGDSMQPLTTWQSLGIYTQWPGIAVLTLLREMFGHMRLSLPSPLGLVCFILIFGAAFLAQAAFFALLIWGLASVTKITSKSSENSK